MSQMKNHGKHIEDLYVMAFKNILQDLLGRS